MAIAARRPRSARRIGCRGLLIERGLADFTVRVAGGTQFLVGSVFQHQQRVTGAGQRLQNFVELALGSCLLACLRVLDDKDHGQDHGPRRVCLSQMTEEGKEAGNPAMHGVTGCGRVGHYPDNDQDRYDEADEPR